MFKFSSSQEFLRQFKGGERSALEKVYLAYVDEVARSVARFLVLYLRSGGGGGGRADVGDLVQEVFARAFGDKARACFDSARDYGPFLGALTRNLLVDWARRRGRELPSDELDAVADGPASERAWSDPATLSTVNQYITELPSDLRDVHEQRYVLCHSQEAACTALGISRQTLRTREKRFREGLRQRLTRMGLGTSEP